MTGVSRRVFVRGVAASAGVLAIGFDPVQRTWTSKASAQCINVPSLDGALFTDPATRADYADDFGHIIANTPVAVLQPGSVNDVVKMVKYCKQHNIKVAARGQGHSTFGQSQVQGGVVIDMATLAEIETIGSSFVKVQGGMRWRDLLEELVPQGYHPPVLTGYVGLSIGGTLSMGGIGAASFRYGPQAANVLELEVVTGNGELKTCSPTQNSALYNAVLGGVGQYGIIVRAKLPLVSVAPFARAYFISYTDSKKYFQDMKKMTSQGRVDGCYGQVNPDNQGGWVYTIVAHKNFHLASPPNDSQILAGLSYSAQALQTMDMDTLSYDTMVDSQMAFLDTVGLFNIPRVWGDYFINGSKVQKFVDAELANITPADLGPAGFVLLFPIKNHNPDTKNLSLRFPNENTVWLFDVLCSALPHEKDAFAAAQVPKARAVFERARQQGGTLYPIGSTPMSTADWQEQYGSLYASRLAAKLAHDPAGIMTPGPNIF